MASQLSAVYKTRTEELMTTYYRTWEVPEFNSLLYNETSRELRTEFDDPTFQLKILIDQDKHVAFHLFSTKTVTLKYSLTIKDQYADYRITMQAYKWERLYTLKKNDILESLKNGHLSLRFKFIVFNNVREVSVPEAQLINDLENLLNDGLYSDVTMKSAEGIEYKVHKNVLASRSEVLKATFEHNTTECLTNIVESHLESDILREVLTFIYSDKAPRVDEMAEKLLAAADYYQLNRLKSLCEKALHKKLTVENAIETLQLADLHSANTLKQFTVEFIKYGGLRLILKTESWARLTWAEQIKIINEYIMADGY